MDQLWQSTELVTAVTRSQSTRFPLDLHEKHGVMNASWTQEILVTLSTAE
jgi:hypothetical protein